MILADVDYVGIGALISATCAGIVSIIVAFRQTAVAEKVDRVHAEVKTSNGHTLGQIAEDVAHRNAVVDAKSEGTL